MSSGRSVCAKRLYLGVELQAFGNSRCSGGFRRDFESACLLPSSIDHERVEHGLAVDEEEHARGGLSVQCSTPVSPGIRPCR